MRPARNQQAFRTMPLALIVMALCSFACGKTIYVDDNAAGANNGESWANAYNYLQDALMAASPGDEIWVAQGVYKPDQFVLSKRANLGRAETFQLVSGVVLKGGYAGLSQPDPNARDVELYETTLSGDLNGDDLPVSDLRNLMSEPTRAENSYNVVTGSGTDNSAVLDGFTVTAGNANQPFNSTGGLPAGTDDDRWRITFGGGMFNIFGRPTVTNCTFSKNSGREGGGMFNYECNLTMSNCRFFGNSAQVGGGMQNWFSTVILNDCIFSENYARNYSWGEGGGMLNYKCSLTMTNCAFIGNSAVEGGGICNEWTSLNLADCTFMGNSAGYGGGMCYGTGTLTNCVFIANDAISGGGLASGGSTLINCAFIANKASDRGGGMYNSSVSAAAINCSFSGNSAEIGGGIYNLGLFTELNLTNCTLSGNSAQHGGALASHTVYGERLLGKLKLMNCILWDGAEIWNDDGSTITISYSDIQDGRAGIYDPYGVVVWDQGNMDADPLFAAAGHWADANEPNVVVEPNDPNAVWVDGDYHLKSQAGRWDPVSENWVMDDVTSPCIDAGDPNSPVGDEPNPNGGRINMGAYGGTGEASKSYSPPWFATTAGPVVAEGLGIVLPHEHIFTDLRGPTAPGYGQADAADVVRVMSPLLADARRKGVGVLIECSSIGVGRNVSIVAQVAQAAGLPVVVPTGVYGRANFAPPQHQAMTEDELTALFIAEIRDGIEGTGIKAGFIKIATGNGPMTALEEKFLRAAGRAARETGAAIASHTPIGSNAVRQTDILQAIDPAIRFVWVHAQNESNRSLHRQLAARGVFIEFDSLGWNPSQDPTFITAIKELFAAGYADRILLSHDAGWYQPGQPNGGTQKPYTYLIDAFIRKLRNAGLDDATIRLITETNPIRAFGFKSN